jgi:hypothetical protein
MPIALAVIAAALWVPVAWRLTGWARRLENDGRFPR